MMMMERIRRAMLRALRRTAYLLIIAYKTTYPPLYCQRCGLRWCDGSRCQRWAARQGWVREGNVWTNANPMTPRPTPPHDPALLSAAMREIAEKHAQWVREQFQQLDIQQTERELVRSMIAPSLLDFCEKEAERL